MLTRILAIAVIAFTAVFAFRLLLNTRQRQSLHHYTRIVAFTLLAISLLALLWRFGFAA